MPRATYIYAFKHSFVFGDENKCGTQKKRNSKESVKKSTRHLKIALQTVLLRERKDKISSFDPSYKNKMINELIQEQHDKQSISCHECIQ